MEIWRYFDAAYILASASMIILSMVTGGLALLVLFASKSHLAWWGRFTLDYFYVQALCQLTPAQAGEVALPYVAGRGRFAPGEIAAGLVIQRMISLGIVFLVAVAGARRWADSSVLWAIGAVGLVICLAFAAVITNARARSWLNEMVGRRFGPILYGFHDTWIGVFRDRRGRLLLHVMLMVARFVMGVVATYAMLLAFGIVVPFQNVAALSALANLASVIPISVNGVGVVESIFVVALADYGYGTEQVLAASLAGRLLSILILLICSAAYWFLQGREGRIAY